MPAHFALIVNAVNFYCHHINDFDAATGHLTWLEDAAYRRLLSLYYRREQALPVEFDSISRLIKAKTKKQRDAVITVLNEFFVLMGDGWHNKRADQEIQRFQSKSSKARDSANLRWTQPDRTANAMRTHSDGNANHEPITNNHKPIPPYPPENPGGAAADEKILIDRLKSLGMRASAKCARDAMQLRSLAVVLTTLDHFEQQLRLADGTMAFDQPLEFLYWRIANPECTENDPQKGWKEPDNATFISRKRAIREERDREQRQESDRKRREAAESPSPQELEFGPTVDALTWDEAIALLPDGPARALAAQKRRENIPVRESPMIRSALIGSLAASAASKAQAGSSADA